MTMKGLQRWRRKRIWIPLFFFVFVYLNNTSFLVEAKGNPFLLAHRGLSQTFPMEGITGDTCTAKRIYKPEHPYLENTIFSMEAAFDAGADVVEIDVQLTKDGQFAVFHDGTLDCRTQAKGSVREYTMAELKKLDIGYGYTADNGKTFPFRGKGIGLMPSLKEVLQRFPDQPFLIHIKNDDPDEGRQLATFLSPLPSSRLEKITVYGGDQAIEVLQQRLPNLRVMSKQTIKDCLIPYIAAGWTGYVPKSCSHTQLHIPEKVAPWLWGWPHRFLQRMEAQDTRVILVAGGGGWSEGFDSAKDIERLPSGYHGGIWTNRIDRIAPLLNR
ncbi:glycerophosphoryl diester phosphodiesterase [Melghirimyces thermohalophilus]|uniref:Glycerophosphoryl diester phosphodiesterase n=2 Tax=Melghirimyces thermohalophilus TaxID=1236220 RepID=A0A1G6I9C6_9BACL|nr:glycerophosphoryl diester phosphodiesterase [Melghirimyces thermohalophilus]